MHSFLLPHQQSPTPTSEEFGLDSKLPIMTNDVMHPGYLRRLGAKLAFVAFMTLSISTMEIAAEGFRNPPSGTFGLGRSGSKIAQIDDSTAVTHNPANLTDIGGIDVALPLLVLYYNVDYSGPLGTATTQDPWKIIPAAYASIPLKDDRFVFGVGVNSPYGIANEWEPNGAFHYTAPYFTELKTINFNPTFAWRISDQFRVGVGLDVTWSELRLKQRIPWAAIPGFPTAPDGGMEGKGDGFGFGGNIGFTWHVNEKNRIAATYRSQMKIDYSGTFELGNIPPGFPALPQSEFGSSITFPNIVGLSYGYEVNEKLRFGVDVEWLQFSKFDTLPLNVGQPFPLVPGEIRQDWVNTFTFGVGGDWQFADQWIWRWSYQYYQTPVPDETFSPTIPDSNQNVVTTAIGYRFGRSALELAYGLVLYDDRTITTAQNPAYNGNYSLNVHLISASYRMTW